MRTEPFYVKGTILGPTGNISGIGNQLFCIAATLAYSIDNDKIPFFPQLGIDREIKKYRNLFYKNLNTNFFTNNFQNYYQENSFNYEEIPKFKGNTLLKGYFQSEKYFKHHRERIIHLLNIREIRDQVIEKYGDHSNHISIHVRRKDYLELKDYHYNLTMEYYKKALKIMGLDNPFIIFSDDIEWCKANFKFLQNVIYSENKEDFEDMILMSTCKNNIIANSTFSWWGAWFNENKDKKILAPKKWFGPKNQMHDLSDLLPSEWTRV